MGRKFRVLELARYCLPLCPEVAAPERRIPLREKILWTAASLFVYLVCCQMPLYGIATASTSDPLYWVRIILASNKGTIMELGIGPLMTAGMVMQLLAGSKLIDYDPTSKDDKMLFGVMQKVLGLLFTLIEAVAYVASGFYGDFASLGAGNAILIVMQLCCAGLVLTLLDEILSRGYGLGDGGTNLFIASNICERIFWQTFSPTTITTDNGMQFEGAVISLFHLLFTRRNKFSALVEAFSRSSGANLCNFIATILICLVVIYCQGFRINLVVKNQRIRGQQNTYPIKLFYTSSVPIILQTALVSNLYFISQLLYLRFHENMFVNWIGRWQTLGGSSVTVPTGGIAYYISPPRSIFSLVRDPIHTITYILFVLLTCAMFSRTWISVSGSSPKDVARSLREQGLAVKGHRDTSMVLILNRYIPTAAVFGGIAIGLLTIAADFLGAIGSGTGILLAVSIVHQYYELLARERETGIW